MNGKEAVWIGQWFASGADVPISDRWDLRDGGTLSNVDVAICGSSFGPLKSVVQAIAAAEAAIGTKVILFDSGGHHARMLDEPGVGEVPGTVLAAFADPAAVMTEALADHDLVVVDLGSVEVGGVDWPLAEVAMLRFLLDAQRVAVPDNGRLVIIVDDASLIFRDPQTSRLAKMCLAEPTGQVSHIMVCDHRLADMQDREEIDLQVRAAEIDTHSPATRVCISTSGEALHLQMPVTDAAERS